MQTSQLGKKRERGKRGGGLEYDGEREREILRVDTGEGNGGCAHRRNRRPDGSPGGSDRLRRRQGTSRRSPPSWDFKSLRQT